MKEDQDLHERMKRLEDMYKESHEKTRKKEFMDKYGAKFKNDEGIGTKILEQLDNRGIDTSAASDAVAEILSDFIREVKALKQEAADMLDKMQDISDSVGGAEPPAEEPLPDPNAAAPPPDPMAGGDPNAAAPPPDPMAGGDPNAAAAPPPDSMAGGDPNMVPSDINLKDIDDEEEEEEEEEEGGPIEIEEETGEPQDDEEEEEEEEEWGMDVCPECGEPLDACTCGEDEDDLVPMGKARKESMTVEFPEDPDLEEDEVDLIMKMLSKHNLNGGL